MAIKLCSLRGRRIVAGVISTLLADLPDSYHRLARALIEAAAAEPGIRALWLHGAHARGEADAGSDLDLLATVDAPFAWRDFLGARTRLVLARELPHGGGFAITAEGVRVDLSVESVADVSSGNLWPRIPLVDKDCLVDREVPAPEAAGPDPARITALVEEALRQQTNFPTVLVRRDWLLGVVAVQQLQMLLYELFWEANKPAPVRGLKQWRIRLTDAQATVMQAFPAPHADEESVRSAQRAAFATFLTEARAITVVHDAVWPDDLAEVTRRLLDARD